MKRARFITFEGMDGCGKTTQLRLAAAWLRELGHDVYETVEPGGTDIGRQIRRILLDPANTAIDSRTELLLYFASRAQNVAQSIRPALQEGKLVLCDRFTDSTVAYQGFGRGLNREVISALDRIACEGLQPDATVLLDIDRETGIERARQRNEQKGLAESRIDEESAAFHDRVREGFRELASQNPERFLVIDARGSVEQVAARLREALSSRV